MGESHSNEKNQRPKRRIDKDNPYRLFTVGLETNEPHYFIQFTDGASVEHCLEIEKPLFELFDQFELDDLSYMNEVDNHYERSEQSEASLHERQFDPGKPFEEYVLDRLESDELHNAILKLPEIQRRRLTLYYYGGLDTQQIARSEGCSQSAVSQTISVAIKNLKKFLK